MALALDPKSKTKEKLQGKRAKGVKPQVEPELALAKAAAFLPGEYAAVRNVLDEMDRRLGRDWKERAIETMEARHDEDQTGPASEKGTMTVESSTERLQGDKQIEARQEGVETTLEDQETRIGMVEVSGGLGSGIW